MTYTSLDKLRAYQAIFKNEAGSIVLDDLKQAHYIEGPLVHGTGPIDPIRMAMAEGERNVVLRIMAILETKESDYGRRNDAPY